MADTRPRLLDLFCGAGGAAKGYQNAGFYVVGVDISPQPHYCGDEFAQTDAFNYLGDWFTCADHVGPLPFVAIHASPPCQAFTKAQNARKQAHLHPDLVAPIRGLLEQAGLPWVIENVVGAPVREDVVLCGTMFALQSHGFELRRHRVFELNWPFDTLTPPCNHVLPSAPVFGHSAGRDFLARYGQFPIEAKRAVMGIDWMNREELREAIPPVFTEFIGAQLLAHVSR